MVGVASSSKTTAMWCHWLSERTVDPTVLPPPTSQRIAPAVPLAGLLLRRMWHLRELVVLLPQETMPWSAVSVDFTQKTTVREADPPIPGRVVCT